MTTESETTTVTISAQVGAASISLTEIQRLKDLVGAPDDANISTGGGIGQMPGVEIPKPYSVTFTWQEEK